MMFTSYAQNLEDVMLWRALKSFGPGFYIDVGACDPHVDSVTKAFYERGWRGINIEPMSRAFELISKARPRDVNLNLALDAVAGSKTFYSIDGGNGLSTSVKEYALHYSEEQRKVETTDVQTSTLAEVCNTFVNQDIQFLKIDVEGSEAAVLLGADLRKFRPWIIVVEATVPNTSEPTHGEWEPTLTAADYVFVYFDGLNRFYLAAEKCNLLQKHFRSPPNWFDHYQSAQTEAQALELAALQAQLQELQHLPFPSFIVSGDSLVQKVEALIANHLFLSDKLRELQEAVAVVLPTAAGEGSNKDRSESVEPPAELAQSPEVRELADAAAAEHEALRLEVAALRLELEERKAMIASLAESNDHLNLEIDGCYQELYEASRHIGALSKERQNLHVAIGSLQHHVRHFQAVSERLAEQQRASELALSAAGAAQQEAAARVAALVSSRSWRITAPLRRISYMKNSQGRKNG